MAVERTRRALADATRHVANIFVCKHQNIIFNHSRPFIAMLPAGGHAITEGRCKWDIPGGRDTESMVLLKTVGGL